MKKIRIFLAFIYLFCQAEIFSSVEPVSFSKVLAPASLFKNRAEQIQLFCRYVQTHLPANPTSLMQRITEPEIFLAAPDSDNFILDPESVFVRRTSDLFLETQISFRYFDMSSMRDNNLKTAKGYFVKARVFQSGKTTWQEFPLAYLDTLPQRISIQFKEREKTDLPQDRLKTGRIGNHEKMVTALLSDPDFLAETLWNIYVSKPYQRPRFTERPISTKEVDSIDVTEDERGSQKQTYRVVVKLVDGVELPAFALKIGISSQQLGKFRENEIKVLRDLQPTGAVPILGAFKEVAAFDIDPAMEKHFRKKGYLEPVIQVEAYSEEFIEGTTLAQGLKLQRVYGVKEISAEAYRQPERQITFVGKPGRFVHWSESESLARFYAYDDIEDVLGADHLKKAITTWTRAAMELSKKNTREDRITCVFDMQPKNIMFRLQRGPVFKQKQGWLYTDIAVAGHPVIIDMGEVVNKKPSGFVQLLFQYYFPFLVSRAPPDFKEETLQTLLHRDNLKLGEEILNGILEAYPHPEEALQMLNLAYQELNRHKDSSVTSLAQDDGDFIQKILSCKSSTEKVNLLWPAITFHALSHYPPLTRYRKMIQNISSDTGNESLDVSL